MSEPLQPYWDGPYLDDLVLDEATRQGDVCIDDVGTMRQRRYSDSWMEGGWTHYGCAPLSSKQLLDGGKRPAWVLRFGKKEYDD